MQRFGNWICAVVLTVLMALDASGQTPQYAFRILFTDKAGSPGTGNPEDYLSPRALARRTAQSIVVDSIDRPVSPDYIDSALALTDGVMHVRSRWMNSIVLLLTDSLKILQLQGKPWVAGFSLVGYYGDILHNKSAVSGKNALEGIEHPPVSQAKTTGSATYYGNTWDQTDLVRGDFLHDNGWRGEGKLIAVLDAGFREVNTHDGFDSLRNDNRIVDQYNFLRDTDYVYDYSFHGTQVLSTMAGLNPGTYVGSAPKASYALYCSEDDFLEQPVEMDNMVAAMERADSIGADIIHASLGYNFFTGMAGFSFDFSDLDGKTTLVARAANIATTRGMLFVTSAGNEGNGFPWNHILTPGDADSAFTVGSVNINKVAASSSGYGPNAAGLIKPDVMALGNVAATFNLGNGYGSFSGTSYAAPQIAGWAACLWQSRPGVKPFRLRDAINRSAHRYSNPGNQSGYGVPNFALAYDALDVSDPRPGEVSALEIWPNPFNDQLWLSVSLKQNTLLTVQLTDITGRIIRKEQKKLPAGTQTFSTSGHEALARGMYLVTVTAGDYRYSQKVIKD